jgi:hypothetical protein
VTLPAVWLPTKEKTRDESAWLHRTYLTIRLTDSINAIRVHTAGKSFPGRLASNEAGAWLLIGDIISTSSEIANSRALPKENINVMTAFTHASEAVVSPGSVLNIGLAAAKFSGYGGGFQAEFVSGQPILFKPLVGKFWHNRAARA